MSSGITYNGWSLWENEQEHGLAEIEHHKEGRQKWKICQLTGKPKRLDDLSHSFLQWLSHVAYVHVLSLEPFLPRKFDLLEGFLYLVN